MRDSTKKAIENYIVRQNQPNKPKRKNEAPEKEVEKEIKKYLDSKNIFYKIVESKAVLSSTYSGYRKGQADAGFPDIVGLLNDGFFLAIELKAKGRRSNLSDDQRAFLLDVICRNGFACVTDSAIHLDGLLSSWINLSLDDRRSLLINDLPKQRAAKIDNSPLFDVD